MRPFLVLALAACSSTAPPPATPAEPRRLSDKDMPAECQEFKLAVSRTRSCDYAKEAMTLLADGYDALWANLRVTPDVRKCKAYALGVTTVIEVLCTPQPALTPEASTDSLPEECHDYKREMERLMGCDKAKAAAGAMKEAFDQTWQTLEEAPPEAQAAMADGCKAAADAIRTTSTSMGC